jgi:hypothetical protein
MLGNCCLLLFIFIEGYMESKGLAWKPGFRRNADWELAERNAWRIHFDEDLDGCLFHFGQANWRRVQ